MFLEIAGNKVFTLSFGRGPRTIRAHSGWAPLGATWRTIVHDHRGTARREVESGRLR